MIIYSMFLWSWHYIFDQLLSTIILTYYYLFTLYCFSHLYLFISNYQHSVTAVITDYNLNEKCYVMLDTGRFWVWWNLTSIFNLWYKNVFFPYRRKIFLMNVITVIVLSLAKVPPNLIKESLGNKFLLGGRVGPWTISRESAMSPDHQSRPLQAPVAYLLLISIF